MMLIEALSQAIHVEFLHKNLQSVLYGNGVQEYNRTEYDDGWKQDIPVSNYICGGFQVISLDFIPEKANIDCKICGNHRAEYDIVLACSEPQSELACSYCCHIKNRDEEYMDIPYNPEDDGLNTMYDHPQLF